MLVDIFIPCFIDQFFPQTGMNMVILLEKLGVDVHYNGNQTCCGMPAFHSGYRDDAKKAGEKFLADFPDDRPVVSPSAACTGFVRNYYSWLFHNTAYHYEYKQLKKNIVEFSDFVLNVLKVEDVGASFPHAVTYHDSCSALREYGLKDESRRLLASVKGLELREMAERETCCGFGGTFSVKFEAIASAMAEQKVKHALDTGAEYIVSTDASCLMHLKAWIDKNQLPIRTIHLIDLLSGKE